MTNDSLSTYIAAKLPDEAVRYSSHPTILVPLSNAGVKSFGEPLINLRQQQMRFLLIYLAFL